MNRPAVLLLLATTLTNCSELPLPTEPEQDENHIELQQLAYIGQEEFSFHFITFTNLTATISYYNPQANLAIGTSCKPAKWDKLMHRDVSQYSVSINVPEWQLPLNFTVCGIAVYNAGQPTKYHLDILPENPYQTTGEWPTFKGWARYTLPRFLAKQDSLTNGTPL